MRTHPEPSVLWREGMFLGPQHLQAFAREVTARISGGDEIGLPGRYGLLRFEVDEEALERDVFSVDAAEVVFKDGTLAVFPTTAEVPQREFAELFTGPELPVWLGIPAARPNVPQIAGGPGGAGGGGGNDAEAAGEARVHRYRVDQRSLFDENLRDADTEIEVRLLQGRLFFGEEDRSGFECVPVAKLVRKGKPEARSALSETYIPPCLACGASAVLSRRLTELAERARNQARDLATRLPSAERLSSTEKGADLAGYVKLQAVNQCTAALDQVSRLPELHPFHVWMTLAQTIGNLAVFGPQRVVPELPRYSQDELDGCFAAAFAAVDELLVAEVSVPYDTTPFVADPMREGFFQAEIPADWIAKNPVFFFAVELARKPEEIVQLVASGVKLVSPADIDRVLQGVVPGIELSHQRTAPLSFPKRPDLHFFRVETEGPSRDSWLKVLEGRAAVILSALSALGDVRYHFYVELRS